jgi:hypothetical protein
MVKRLRGLDDLEQTACLIAERALGVTATPYDVAGRQRAVEAFLDYPDGRRCAFEVTQLRPAWVAQNFSYANTHAMRTRCPSRSPTIRGPTGSSLCLGTPLLAGAAD